MQFQIISFDIYLIIFIKATEEEIEIKERNERRIILPNKKYEETTETSEIDSDNHTLRSFKTLVSFRYNFYYKQIMWINANRVK